MMREKQLIMENENRAYYYKMMQSPTGGLKLIASDKGLAAVLWHADNYFPQGMHGAVKSEDHPLLVETEQQLNEYFDGKRKVFDLPFDITGSDFQMSVWMEILNIPFGETWTYGELARKLGDSKMARAVGTALNRNPVPIIIPCHRVIGASGKLVGFGGGLENKHILLRLEQPAQPDLWAQK